MLRILQNVALGAILVLAACAHAPPRQHDTLVVAELHSLTLTRRDWQAERRAFDAEVRRQARRHVDDSDVEEAIVVSNHCGEAIATYRVIRSTQPTPRLLRQTFSIGEFCEPPIPFQEGQLLLVVDSRTNAVVAHYPIFRNYEDELFAFSEFGSMDALSGRSAETQRLLTPTTLAQPLEYYTTRLQGEALAEYLASRPPLENRDGTVWIVSAVPVETIFPGLRFDDLLD